MKGIIEVLGQSVKLSVPMMRASAKAESSTPKISWQQLPGRKLKAYVDVQPRGFERGLRDSDMDEVQQWIWTNIPTAKRLSFDMWLFKQDKHVTMFLLKWSS
jgi:hypothetical protein